MTSNLYSCGTAVVALWRTIQKENSGSGLLAPHLVFPTSK